MAKSKRQEDREWREEQEWQYRGRSPKEVREEMWDEWDDIADAWKSPMDAVFRKFEGWIGVITGREFAYAKLTHTTTEDGEKKPMFAYNEMDGFCGFVAMFCIASTIANTVIANIKGNEATKEAFVATLRNIHEDGYFKLLGEAAVCGKKEKIEDIGYVFMGIKKLDLPKYDLIEDLCTFLENYMPIPDSTKLEEYKESEWNPYIHWVNNYLIASVEKAHPFKTDLEKQLWCIRRGAEANCEGYAPHHKELYMDYMEAMARLAYQIDADAFTAKSNTDDGVEELSRLFARILNDDNYVRELKNNKATTIQAKDFIKARAALRRYESVSEEGNAD